jgi:hypothetical protein
VKSFFESVWAVLRVALYGWLVALIRFLRQLCAWLRRLVSEDRGNERERKAAKTNCVPIRDPAFVRPDPLIYSQRYLAAHGVNYSWDNPDIRLFLSGTAVDSHDLAPLTTYDVVIRVWNGSTDCPVVAMPVHLSYLSFGVGTVSNPIQTRKVDVGVKGGTNNPSLVVIPWTTPAGAGHYCLQALLDPVADLDFGNNLGQHNTDVVAAHSPATFSFALRNDDTRKERTYRFEVDAYRVGEPQPCPDPARDDPKRDPAARHRADHPLPPGWDVQLVPAHPTLAAGAAVSVVVTVTPPAGFLGSQVVNVHAFYREFHDDRLAGGVTITVTAGP